MNGFILEADQVVQALNQPLFPSFLQSLWNRIAATEQSRHWIDLNRGPSLLKAFGKASFVSEMKSDNGQESVIRGSNYHHHAREAGTTYCEKSHLPGFAKDERDCSFFKVGVFHLHSEANIGNDGNPITVAYGAANAIIKKTADKALVEVVIDVSDLGLNAPQTPIQALTALKVISQAFAKVNAGEKLSFEDVRKDLVKAGLAENGELRTELTAAAIPATRARPVAL